MKSQRRTSSQKSLDLLETKIVLDEDFESPYPFCTIPPNYFDRMLQSRGNGITVSIHSWDRIRAEISKGSSQPE